MSNLWDKTLQMSLLKQETVACTPAWDPTAGVMFVKRTGASFLEVKLSLRQGHSQVMRTDVNETHGWRLRSKLVRAAVFSRGSW